MLPMREQDRRYPWGWKLDIPGDSPGWEQGWQPRYPAIRPLGRPEPYRVRLLVLGLADQRLEGTRSSQMVVTRSPGCPPPAPFEQTGGWKV